jgi:hypothetical protein
MTRHIDELLFDKQQCTGGTIYYTYTGIQYISHNSGIFRLRRLSVLENIVQQLVYVKSGMDCVRNVEKIPCFVLSKYSVKRNKTIFFGVQYWYTLYSPDLSLQNCYCRTMFSQPLKIPVPLSVYSMKFTKGGGGEIL